MYTLCNIYLVSTYVDMTFKVLYDWYRNNDINNMILLIYIIQYTPHTGVDTGFCSGGGTNPGAYLPPELLRGGGFSDNLVFFL